MKREKDRILLFIPAYNCEKQITRVLSQLDETIMNYITEVIVVNNQSSDDTEKVILDYKLFHWSMPIKLLRTRENYGLGGSHKVAFDYALKNDFDYVIVLHGDDQGDIHDLLPILKKRIYRAYDCVLGGRFMLQSRLEGYSAFRTLGNIVFNFLYAAGIRQRVFDLGAGLNIYSTDMLKDRYYRRFPDDLTFNCCMLLAVSFYHQTSRYFPISWREDDQTSNVKMAGQALKTLGLLARYVDCPTSIRGEYRENYIEHYEAEEIG